MFSAPGNAEIPVKHFPKMMYIPKTLFQEDLNVQWKQINS